MSVMHIVAFLQTPVVYLQKQPSAISQKMFCLGSPPSPRSPHARFFLRTVRTMRIGKTKHFRHTMGYGVKKMNSFPKNVLLGQSAESASLHKLPPSRITPSVVCILVAIRIIRTIFTALTIRTIPVGTIRAGAPNFPSPLF